MKADNSPWPTIIVLSAFLIGLTCIFGPDRGTITVESDPTGSGFSLSGPEEFSGTTPWSTDDAEPGTYTITWLDIEDYNQNPASDSDDVSQGGVCTKPGSISFSGVYGKILGSVSVTSDPSGASFSLSGPSSYSGTTPFAANDALIGNYTITWGDLEGYDAPPADTNTVAENDTVTFNGRYDKLSIEVLGQEILKRDLTDLIKGNLFIVGGYSEEGFTTTSIVTGLITMMVVNVIDFTALNSFDLSFTDSAYVFTSGVNYLKLTFYFAEDYGDFQAGDKIPYNLFDPGSYVSNVQIDWTDISYDQGPLFNLIDGGVSFSEIIPSIRLNTTKISFGCESRGTRVRNYDGVVSDTLIITMSTPPVVVQDIQAEFESEGYGVSFDSTLYNSKYYNTYETIYDSMFYIKKTGENSYYEGNYTADCTKDVIHFYMKGFVSNIANNYTRYYLDPECTEYLGMAAHDLSLTFGNFYSAEGDSIYYNLEEF
jgi:hypothetical protein